MINRMGIKNRILQSIRRRKDGVLPRYDETWFGSRRQVSAALLHLRANGLTVRIERGAYVLPKKLAAIGVETLLEVPQHRQLLTRLHTVLIKRLASRTTPTSQYVNNLAEQVGTIYKPTFCDHWANVVTRLSGDEIRPDATDDLLVALTRDGVITPGELVKLAMDHHRALKLSV